MEIPTPRPLVSSTPTPADTNEPFDRIQVLEVATSGLPKLKEQNYLHWKIALGDAIKVADLWGYVDGSVVRPSPINIAEYKKYTRESVAVRSAIADALEPVVHKYLEGALTSREAWLALEKHYQPSDDAYLASVAQQLAELKLPKDGDVIEHVANFCQLRRLLAKTRFALNAQASIDMLYRSLPTGYRQWILAQNQTVTEDFGSLCSSLRTRYRIMNLEASIPDTSSSPITVPPPTQATPGTDYSDWGVPEDIRTFGLTGAKNPLLNARAEITCRDCLLKDHRAGTPECPQFVWRRELWGEPAEEENATKGQSVGLDGLESQTEASKSDHLNFTASNNTTVDACLDTLDSASSTPPSDDGDTAQVECDSIKSVDEPSAATKATLGFEKKVELKSGLSIETPARRSTFFMVIYCPDTYISHYLGAKRPSEPQKLGAFMSQTFGRSREEDQCVRCVIPDNNADMARPSNARP